MQKRSKFIEFLFPSRFSNAEMKENNQKEIKRLYNRNYYWKHLDECKQRRKEYYKQTGN